MQVRQRKRFLSPRGQPGAWSTGAGQAVKALEASPLGSGVASSLGCPLGRGHITPGSVSLHVSVGVFALLPIKTSAVGFRPILGPHLTCIPSAVSMSQPGHVHRELGCEHTFWGRPSPQNSARPPVYEMQAWVDKTIPEFHSKSRRCTTEVST